jgi:integrase
MPNPRCKTHLFLSSLPRLSSVSSEGADLKAERQTRRETAEEREVAMATRTLALMDRDAKTRRNPRGVFEKHLGSGEWWICYWDAQGRKRREKAGTKSNAIDLYRKRKNEALQGKKLPEKLRRATVTFSEIARDALAYSRAHKRTYDDDVQRLERIRGWFGDRSADSVTPQDIERHFEECIEEEEWAPSTVNHYRSLLSLSYRLAIRNGKTSTNPARATRHRREDNSRVRYLTPEEEAKLRAVLETDWSGHVPEFDLALHTGLRVSEMYSLDWQDVDLARRLLTVRRGKNGESRYARLNSVALKALTGLRKRGDGTDPVIRNLEGEPLASPRYWWDKAIREANISNFHWHDLRHTFASRLAMAGVGLRAIQDALGHKSIAMTVRYSHLAPDFLLDVVEKLVPKPAEADSGEATDTTTDTGVLKPELPKPAHIQ